jgi:hypothetical protein
MKKPSYLIYILLLFCLSAMQFSCCDDTPDPEMNNETLTSQIFQVVEESPLFPGCEHLETKSEKEECSGQKLLDFVDSLLIMPREVLLGNAIGMGVVTFVVDTSGNIIDEKVIRSVCIECDAQMLYIVRQMPQWIPGGQRGRKVDVQFNLPIKFYP